MKLKTIIAGSRGIDRYGLVRRVLDRRIPWEIGEVVSGTAAGVDRLGERWANENHIKIKRFPADWNKFGRSAGPIRNAEMADYAQALVAIWDGRSRGTKNMIDTAIGLGLRVYVWRIDLDSGEEL